MPGELLLQRLNKADQVITVVAVLAGLGEQVTRVGEQGGALGGAGDGDATAAAEFQQAFVAQEAQGAQYGVAVDAEHGGQVHGGGQAFAWADLAFGDSPADLRGGLLVQWGGIGGVQRLNRACGTSHDGTTVAP